MIEPEIIKIIEDNIDLHPDEIMNIVRNQYPDMCKVADCLCQAVKQTITLYKDYYGRGPVPLDLHRNLMARIKDECEK